MGEPPTFKPSNAVGPEDLYVERPADQRYLAELIAGRDCHVTGSRMSGKSSLLIHAMPAARAQGFEVVRTAFALESDDSPETLVRHLVERLAGAMEDSARLEALLQGPTPTLDACLRAALPTDGRRLVVMIDEFDTIDHSPFAAQLLSQLRGVQEARVADAELARLQFSFCGVRGPSRLVAQPDLVAELEGKTLWLDDFVLDEATIDSFARGFPAGTRDVHDLSKAILAFTGGFPRAATWLALHTVEQGWRYSHDYLDHCRAAVRTLVGLRPPTLDDERSQQGGAADWLVLCENYLLALRPQIADALDLYSSILGADAEIAQGRSPTRVVRFDRRALHQWLLLWAGLSKTDDQERLRARSEFTSLFFDRSWCTERRAQFGARRAGVSRSTKRICVLLAGGTIGMAENPEGEVRAPADPRSLIQTEALERIAHVSLEPVFSFDSADVGPPEWERLARRISQLQRQFDGFVVAIGTDTMAYAASAVAFAFGPGLSFPIVFTGSQTTIDIDHGDAATNLLRACLVATTDIAEVVIAFDDRILRAVRAEKRDDRRFDGFASPGYPELGYVAETVELIPYTYRAAPGISRSSRPAVEARATFDRRILHVVQVPGAPCSPYEHALDLRDPATGELFCHGVVVQSLGAGNLPSRDPEFEMCSLISKARGLGLPVVLTSQYRVHLANLARYSPARAALQAGAIPAGYVTTPAAAAKFAWVVAEVDERINRGLILAEHRVAEIEALMQTDLVGEGGTVEITADEGIGDERDDA